MNKIWRKLFFILFLAFGIALSSASECLKAVSDSDVEMLLSDKPAAKVTMDLQNASLRDVLKMLSVQSGLNFIASEAVADRKLTLYLDNIPIRDAMDKIFKVNNLSYDLDTQSNIFIVKDWGKPAIELDTRIYFLKYVRVTNSLLNQGFAGGSTSASAGGSTSASAGGSTSVSTGLKDALSMVISEYGKINEDPATNSMIITDMPNKFLLIEQIISKLDVPIPQVMIEVEILDVNKSEVDKMGIKFTSSDDGWFKYAGPNLGGTYFPFVSDTFRKAAAKIAPTPASWTMGGFGFILEFLSSRSTTKFLARPKLFVLNNETAELKLSSNEAIGSSTTTQGQGSASTSSSTAERAETGVILQVTPQISLATGEITMILQPTVKEAVASSISLGTQKLKDVEERSLKSTIRVKDRETIIIGGLIRQKKPLTETRVPFFSDIPILGLFFRHKTTEGTADREILVFITPRIMKSSQDFIGGRQLPAKMPEERKQDDFTSAERQQIISRALWMHEANTIAK